MCAPVRPESGEIPGPERKSPFRPARRSVLSPEKNCRLCSNGASAQIGSSVPVERFITNHHSASAATLSAVWPSGRSERYWLHILLLIVTFVTTTAFGSALATAFAARVPLSGADFFLGYIRLAHLDPHFWSGLQFSVPLLAILLTHEAGHYVAARYWAVDASLPYFLPSPMLLGTFGAFIRIRSPIYTRRVLFDIGASGPFAGFAMLLPLLVVGVWKSHVIRGGFTSEFQFSTPLLLRALEAIRFGAVPVSRIQLHPIALAAWAGLLATSINLLPMGQLDGGHVVYSVVGEKGHRLVSTILVGVLVVLGFWYWAWWAWAVVMFFFGRRHPLVFDSTAVTQPRRWLAVAALVLLIICFSVVPVATR